MQETDPEKLSDVQADLTAAGLEAEEIASIRIAESGRVAGLPYLPIPTSGAIEYWQRLRGLCFGRRYPVVVNHAEDCPQHMPIQPRKPIAEVTAEGRRLDVKDMWQPLLAKGLERWRHPTDTSPPKSEMSDRQGDWPAQWPGRDVFVGPNWGINEGKPTADILLPACPESWMAPAYIYAEPHNYLPKADLQCAVLRSWYRRFGAELVYEDGAVYEFAVGQAPQNRGDALQLAREHYLFCPDRFEQMNPDYKLSPIPGSLQAYAVMLMASSVWYFWWD